jgi:hypothetical protein
MQLTQALGPVLLYLQGDEHSYFPHDRACILWDLNQEVPHSIEVRLSGISYGNQSHSRISHLPVSSATPQVILPGNALLTSPAKDLRLREETGTQQARQLTHLLQPTRPLTTSTQAVRPHRGLNTQWRAQHRTECKRPTGWRSNHSMGIAGPMLPRSVQVLEHTKVLCHRRSVTGQFFL